MDSKHDKLQVNSSRKPQATLRDIAKAAGVSLGTVHNVLHAKQGRVSVQTSQMVRKVAVELGYQLKNQGDLLKKV